MTDLIGGSISADIWTLAALVGFSVFLAVFALFAYLSQRMQVQRKRRLKGVLSHYVGNLRFMDQREKPVPAIARIWLDSVKFLVPSRSREKLGMHLAFAGKRTPNAVEQVAVLKVQLLVLGVIFGLLVIIWQSGGMWLAPAVLAALGYYAPDAWLAREARDRTERIGEDLPEAIDLLTLCVGAGQGLQAALQQVASHQKGPLAAEFTRVLREMSLGVSRVDAFEGLVARTQQPDLQRFAHAIMQVDRLGIPLSMILHEQSRDMRERRRARAKEKAEKLGVKVLLPLMVCLLPALLIIVVGPSVLNLMRMFSGQ